MKNQNNFPGLQLKEGIFDNVPHIMINDDGKLGTNRQQPIPQLPQAPLRRPPTPQPYQQPYYPRQPKQPEDLVDKLKKYALIFFVCLILGTAGFMVLKVIFGRFF